VIRKEAEQILKYKEFTIRTHHMWNVKTNAIPVILEATGTISKLFRKHLSKVRGKHRINELQPY
jgi:hypothetical protein